MKGETGSELYSFESPAHTSSVLQGLNSLRNKQLLLDVTLIVQGHKFAAHRVVLAACSDYFRAMFTDAMLEQNQKEIHLNGVSGVGIQQLMEYAYTSRITLNTANIQDVLGAASHLQIIPIVEACSQFLSRSLDIENCVDILNIADTYSLQSLQQTVYCFIGRNLDKLACLLEFQHMSARQLQHFLNCDFPIDCSEAEVLQAVLCWLHFDIERRRRFASEILNCIHFEHISKVDFQNIKRLPMYNDIVKSYPKAAGIIHRKFVKSFSSSSSMEEEDLSCLINPRGFEKAVVNVGGFQAHKGLTNELTYFHLSSGKWRKLTSIPHVEQCDFGMAVMDNTLYVVGGCFNQSLQENFHPFGFRYDPRSDKWTTIAPMNHERCRFFLGALENKLYAIGGIGEQEHPNDGACELYDPNMDTWQPIASLPIATSQHAGAVEEDCIYMSGGLDPWEQVQDQLLCYDIGIDEWVPKANMLTPRADHCVIAHQGKLYVAGGWYEDIAGNRVIINTVDCYDIESNQWRTITELPTPRYHASMVVMNNCLYVVGGFGAGQYNRASRRIERFHLETETWVEHEDYPIEVWEHMSCVLYIPTCRKDRDLPADFESL